jgi:hypothetical protein
LADIDIQPSGTQCACKSGGFMLFGCMIRASIRVFMHDFR